MVVVVVVVVVADAVAGAGVDLATLEDSITVVVTFEKAGLGKGCSFVVDIVTEIEMIVVDYAAADVEAVDLTVVSALNSSLNGVTFSVQ